MKTLAARNRRGKKPQGCWPKQMTGLSHVSAASVAAPAAEVNRSLEDQAQGHAGRAADDVVPEVGDALGEIEPEDQHE